jgi:hypothetical protein
MGVSMAIHADFPADGNYEPIPHYGEFSAYLIDSLCLCFAVELSGRNCP